MLWKYPTAEARLEFQRRLVKFWVDDYEPSHYQFEMIHPFIDGNGRIGRLLTLLFLMDRNVIQQPVLSLSKNLMSSSFKYFTSIASVEVYGAYEKWVKYFLQQLHSHT